MREGIGSRSDVVCVVGRGPIVGPRPTSVCVYQSASWISKIATNSELVSAIQLEGDVLSNLISLDFLFKALLSSYGMICSP